MESAPSEDTVDLGYEEGKIGDDVYVHAGNNVEITSYETLSTPIIPLVLLFLRPQAQK